MYYYYIKTLFLNYNNKNTINDLTIGLITRVNFTNLAD